MIRKNIIGILVMILMASLVLAAPKFSLDTDKATYDVQDPIIVTVSVNKFAEEGSTTLNGINIELSQDLGYYFKDAIEVGVDGALYSPLINMVSLSKPYRWKYSSPVVTKEVTEPSPLFSFQIDPPLSGHAPGSKHLELVNSYYFDEDVNQVDISIEPKIICVGGAADEDADGVCDEIDNCPGVPNVDQVDTDNDGEGDLCDEDIDGDDVLNNNDNCPNDFNPGQENDDAGQDEVGNACDNDTDNDDVPDCGDDNDCDTPDDNDNCPNDFNPGGQDADFDNDEIGDDCDMDQDGDGVLNDSDQCPNTPPEDVEGENVDNNGCGESQGQDNDGDGIDDNLENPDCIYDPDDNPLTVDVIPPVPELGKANVFTEGPFIGCIIGDLNKDSKLGLLDLLLFPDQWFLRGSYDEEDSSLPINVDRSLVGGIQKIELADLLLWIDAYSYRAVYQ